MPRRDNFYQSILNSLESIPTSYLQDVDAFLHNLLTEIKDKEQNRLEILKLSGGWADMSDSDFYSYLQIVKESRSDMFNRDIQL